MMAPPFDGLITRSPPPPKRAKGCDGPEEHDLSEGAIMVAFALHLLRTVPELAHVTIHPDGEHGKRFDFRDWLGKQGFHMTAPQGSTAYGGTYTSSTGATVLVDPSSIRARERGGDVVAEVAGASYVAECKGGIINTRHSGQVSGLRKGLCETIGQCLSAPTVAGRRQFAVVPRTKVTEEVARRMAKRAFQAGIEIALIDGRGNVFDVKPT